MSKGRKNSCPVSVADWLIEIENKAAASETWVRINGLDSLDLQFDSDTDDGSTATDLWEEPFIRKRSGSLSLEGKPKIDETTGDRDPGQEMLNSYAEADGCDADCTLRLTDPFGHRVVGDFIVTSHSRSTNEDGDEEESWDLDLVGEMEEQPFIAVTGVATTPATTTSVALGATENVTVAFTPADASNQRYRVKSSSRSTVAIKSVSSGAFVIQGMKAGTADVTVTSVNGTVSATLKVTVTAP